MPRRRVLPALVALPLLAACGLLEPDHGRVSVRFHERAPLERGRLVVNVHDGEDHWYLEGTDLEAAGDGWLASRPLRVRADGSVRVTATLRGSGTTIAAAGEVVLPLDAQRHWQVRIFPSSAPAAEACDGCDGIQRFPIAPAARPSARDWLYLAWTDRPTGPSSAARE